MALDASDRREEEENLGYYENYPSMEQLKRQRAGQAPQDCWRKTGGSSEEEWNEFKKDEKWKCYYCKFTSSNFIDFIP